METSLAQAPAFGRMLRRYRQTAGLTQEALAERAHLSARAIAALERGVNRAPRQDTLQLLADALALAGPARAALEATARAARPRAPVPTGHNRPSSADPLPPLVGRADELALLERHLSGEGPPVLLLSGEPGIGKSRLLWEAAERAVGYGWTLLSGGCRRRGQGAAQWEGEPYAPLPEALERYLHQRTTAQRRDDLQGCAWLARLLPELVDGSHAAFGSLAPRPSWKPVPTEEHRLMTAPAQEHRLLTRALARFLANVAGPAGTLLILDDLQWAGADALDLLATLVSADPVGRLRVVGAYRDSEVHSPPAPTSGHPLAGILADLIQRGLVRHRTLRPLQLAEVEHLLAALVDGAAEPVEGGGDHGAPYARVGRRTGGVPFYVVSCAHDLRRGARNEEQSREQASPEAVPWEVTQSIRQRLAVLPVAAQEVLGVAAVAGRAVEPAVLLAAVGRPEPEVVGALEVARRSQLLVEEEQGYRVGHDLIREVVEADLGAARRQVLHRHLATVLAQGAGPPPLEQLAYHYGRGGDQEHALRYLEQAGDRAWAQHANVAAEGYYRELMGGLDHLDRPLDAARARVKLGTVLETTAQHEPALAVLEEAAETYRAADETERLAHVLARIGCLHIGRGSLVEGVERLQPVAERFATREPSYRIVQLDASLASLLQCCGRYREAMAAAERARARAAALGDDRSLAEALWALGVAQLMTGRLAAARQTLEMAAQRAEAAGDLANLMSVLSLLSDVWLRYGDLARSRRYCARSLALAERIGYAEAMTAYTAQRGIIAYVSGEWAQARRDGEQALVLGRDIGAGWAASTPQTLLGCVCYGEGLWEEARGYLEPCAPLAPSRLIACGVLAECAVRDGHAAAARDDLSALIRSVSGEGADVSPLLPLLAWAHLETGDVVTATASVDAALTQARAENDRLTLVEALRVQALVALRQEHWTMAEQALEEGLTLARGMPYPYMEGRLLHLYGALPTWAGEPALVRERLEAAAVILRRLGARREMDEVEQALRASA